MIRGKQGPLIKKSKSNRSWRQKWFMISSGWLFYFNDENDCKLFCRNIYFSEKEFTAFFDKYVKGCIDLKHAKWKKVCFFFLSFLCLHLIFAQIRN